MIKLNKIMTIEEPTQYKLHAAVWNGSSHPLDDFITDFTRWIGWNIDRHGEAQKNRFNRRYIISFIDFYPQKGTYLFGGIFEVLNTYPDHYDIRLCDEHKELIGRLKVRNIVIGRTREVKFEKHYDDIEVVELFDKPYSSHIFPGYENIDFSFEQIKDIINKESPDWKSALGNMKGIYMLTDRNTGKRYIGSAYGDRGIWSRWSEYCSNGHGGNVQLRSLVEKNGMEYVETYFKFTLLEIHPMFILDEIIIQREQFWKDVMMSGNKRFGYNSN